MFLEIRKAVLSGIMISIGGGVYLSCLAKNLPWFGAFLFATGLFTICEYGFNLYTGKVGYLANRFREGKYWVLVLVTLCFNLLTTWLLGALAKAFLPDIKALALSVYKNKLSLPLWRVFVSAVFCGILMYIAVDTWSRGKKEGIFLCIPTFILCGFDHCVANSFYSGFALGFDVFTLDNILFSLICILGNGCGAVIIPLMLKNKK